MHWARFFALFAPAFPPHATACQSLTVNKVVLATRTPTWAHAMCQAACAAACDGMSQSFCEKGGLPHAGQHGHMHCAGLPAQLYATSCHSLAVKRLCLPHASHHAHMQCAGLHAQPHALACHSLTVKKVVLATRKPTWEHVMRQVACVAACNSMSPSYCEAVVLTARKPTYAHPMCQVACAAACNSMS